MPDHPTPASLHLYHWSPTSRRKQIQRYGFRPGSRSLDGAWRPPFVCFSDDPHLAWSLSGYIHPEITSWDLWLVSDQVVTGYETLSFDGGPLDGQVKEYRVYERIPARDAWYVATREQDTA
ncbi:hypothetical protein [Kineococcus radiotolerans]|uniref:Uncharacterized protein n=1 Tax=Kineococcus radiotolerans (strain ATCC BAA-149 / DSM 14245 / SRS30216) TaxID=266940 RepID=A6W8S8_KINRD|nr:hypothetical protein [Kineococcus radiotolerans]ABS03217.1 hypothetical protein Krad_1731 [Kineococcus radiotolerans SRS30216 = ATCC BAA-149]